MRPDLPIAPPGQVPPGAIGHNRGAVGRNYAFFPPEGVLKSRLPAWSATTAHILAAPALGAGFVQAMLAIEPGGGTAAPIQVAPQHFLYLVEGSLEVAIGGDAPVALAAGGFAYVPPETRFTALNRGAGVARLLILKKRYELAEGLPVPDAIIGQHQAMPMTNHTGLDGRGFKHLLPFGDLR
ncbi:MAG TPA: cupin domain-containing protein, partial [Roseomonas sp.]